VIEEVLNFLKWVNLKNEKLVEWIGLIWGFEKLKLKEQSMGVIVTESMTRASVHEFSLHLRERAEQKASDAACALEPIKCREIL
jgi:hypothetical protein